MYDPSVGRWLTEDPTGFAAGDADLYRYVGNDPTNATDPSGLAEKPITSITYEHKGLTAAERVVMMKALWPAVSRIQKAEAMLTEHWDKLEALSTHHQPGAKAFVMPSYVIMTKSYTVINPYVGTIPQPVRLPPPVSVTYRQMYIDRIHRVTKYLRDDRLAFKADRKPATAQGTDAYVRIWLFETIIEDTINICKPFWGRGSGRQTDVMAHELGRIAGFVGDDNTGDERSDVYQWDKRIEFLANMYDKMEAGKKK